MNECVICGAAIKLDAGTEKGELIECPDCGTELEVVDLEPLQLAEAPTADEDWGE